MKKKKKRKMFSICLIRISEGEIRQNEEKQYLRRLLL